MLWAFLVQSGRRVLPRGSNPGGSTRFGFESQPRFNFLFIMRRIELSCSTAFGDSLLELALSQSQHCIHTAAFTAQLCSHKSHTNPALHS